MEVWGIGLKTEKGCLVAGALGAHELILSLQPLQALTPIIILWLQDDHRRLQEAVSVSAGRTGHMPVTGLTKCKHRWLI